MVLPLVHLCWWCCCLFLFQCTRVTCLTVQVAVAVAVAVVTAVAVAAMDNEDGMQWRQWEGCSMAAAAFDGATQQVASEP